MTTTHHEHQPAAQQAYGMGGAPKIALLMVAVIAGAYLLREHWSHVTGDWIYLLLLACPLMHLFRGHGGHGDGRSALGARRDREE